MIMKFYTVVMFFIHRFGNVNLEQQCRVGMLRKSKGEVKQKIILFSSYSSYSPTIELSREDGLTQHTNIL